MAEPDDVYARNPVARVAHGRCTCGSAGIPGGLHGSACALLWEEPIGLARTVGRPLTMLLLADILRAGAVAANRINPCPDCGALRGQPCRDDDGAARYMHPTRQPGDVNAVVILRTMAERAEEINDETDDIQPQPRT